MLPAFATLLMLVLGAHASPPVPPPTPGPATRPALDEFEALEFLVLPPPPDSVEVAPGLFVHAEFTAFHEHKGEKPPGKPTKLLRLRDDPAYGVSLLFFPTQDFKGGEVRYRETLTLPAKPGGWDEGYDEELSRLLRHKRTINPDGRACTTEITFPMRPGQMVPSIAADRDGREAEFYFLYPFPVGPWGLAEDDPPGEWMIEAFVNDKPVAQATFQVIIAERPDNAPRATVPASALARAAPVP